MSGGLIVTADDLGLTAGISNGILEAHEHGIVTAASLMATGTDFERAVSRLAEHPTLDVGVHLALDEERPLLEGLRTIVGADGAFLTRGKLLLRLALRRVDLDEVEAVWDAEFSRIVAAGLRPSFVNSHGHVHCHPSLFPIAVRLARRHGVPAIRRPVEAGWRGPAPDLARAALVTASSRWSFARTRSPLRSTDGFLGLVESGRLDAGTLERLIAPTGGGVTELMAHPGRADAETRARYGHWRYRWEDELAALTGIEPPAQRLTTFLAEFPTL